MKTHKSSHKKSRERLRKKEGYETGKRDAVKNWGWFDHHFQREKRKYPFHFFRPFFLPQNFLGNIFSSEKSCLRVFFFTPESCQPTLQTGLWNIARTCKDWLIAIGLSKSEYVHVHGKWDFSPHTYPSYKVRGWNWCIEKKEGVTFPRSLFQTRTANVLKTYIACRLLKTVGGKNPFPELRTRFLGKCTYVSIAERLTIHELKVNSLTTVYASGTFLPSLLKRFYHVLPSIIRFYGQLLSSLPNSRVIAFLWGKSEMGWDGNEMLVLDG